MIAQLSQTKDGFVNSQNILLNRFDALTNEKEVHYRTSENVAEKKCVEKNTLKLKFQISFFRLVISLRVKSEPKEEGREWILRVLFLCYG